MSDPFNPANLRAPENWARRFYVPPEPAWDPDEHAGTESPVEWQFLSVHRGLNLPELRGLVVQYPVPGTRFRLDFALPACRIGIEIDGHASHSSTTSIARDHHRQRQLGALCWYIIRFGGSEIYNYPAACVREAAQLTQLWRRPE